MVNLLNIAGGILLMAVGIGMVVFAMPRGGASPRFLQSENVSILYVIASLALIVAGLAWAVSYAVAVFSS